MQKLYKKRKDESKTTAVLERVIHGGKPEVMYTIDVKSDVLDSNQRIMFTTSISEYASMLFKSEYNSKTLNH